VHIASHLKTFSRKGRGRRQPASLAAAVDRALGLLQGRALAENVAVSCSIPGGARVLGDDVRLEQVIVNLVGNAFDAMRDSAEKRLSISVAADNGDWILRVSDSGPGIAAEHAALLFDPFFTTKGVGDGLGLGLSLSDGIVRDMGGTLRAENGPQGGAVFIVALPALGQEEEKSDG
jgi:two-component system C4-dicarboxylate transport sensor histidine kinase DctB